MLGTARKTVAAALVAVVGIASALPQAVAPGVDIVPSDGGQPGAVPVPVPVPAPEAVPDVGSGGSVDNNSTLTMSACNNSPELCLRPYNQVTHLGAHNIAFLRDESTGFSLAGNHYKNATLALDAGLRLLQAQVHQKDGRLHLCHGSCGILDAGPLQTWLAAVNAWVEAHPSDVVTLLLVNAMSRPATEFGAVFEAAGIARHGYVPPPGSGPGPTADWPTLQSMIDGGGRVVSFLTRTDGAPPEHPYLLPEFSYVFETNFEVTQMHGFNCTLHRPEAAGTAAEALAAGYLSLVNHFKYEDIFAGILVPDVSSLPIVNSAGAGEVGNLGRHLQQCAGEWSSSEQQQRRPNFVLIDFWDEGDPLVAVDRTNDLVDIQGRRLAPADRSGAAGLGETRLGCGVLATLMVGWFMMWI